MNNKNVLLSFLQEIFKRLSSRSPKFFVVWQWVTGAVAAVTAIPQFLEMFGMVLPSWALPFATKAISICSTLAFFFSKLPVETSTVIGVTSDGSVIKKTDEDKVPFTAQAEKTKALTEGLASDATLNDVHAVINTPK